MVPQALSSFSSPVLVTTDFQPVFVDDVAELAVEAGEREDNTTIDAVGPETYTRSRRSCAGSQSS